MTTPPEQTIVAETSVLVQNCRLFRASFGNRHLRGSLIFCCLSAGMSQSPLFLLTQLHHHHHDVV
jgi:hypothetical protein